MNALHPLIPLFAPVALVLIGGLAALGAEPFLGHGRRHAAKHAWLPWIAGFFLVAAGIIQALAPQGSVHGIFAMDTARLWLCEAIIAATLCSIAGLQQSLGRDDYAGGEPYALTMLAAVGAMLMVMATDSLALFAGLEVASLSIYALVGLRRNRSESNEALFKYFVMGAVFSALFLYGTALTYGATGSTHFGVPVIDASHTTLLLLGQALMIIGLLFKVGAVPFHFWSPDAYTGAPAVVTGFMGAVVKVGGFAALGAVWLNLVAVVSHTTTGAPLALNASVAVTRQAQDDLATFQLVFLVIGLLSLVVGNFSAIKQTSVRRLSAYSSVAHAGYMLLALALPLGALPLSLGSLWIYLAGYAIATAAALAAVSAMSGREDQHDHLAGLSGQGRASPLYGITLTVFIASFAGIPPTIGFLGKFLVLSDLVAKGYWKIAGFAMIMAVVGAVYYLRLLIAIWSTPGKEAAQAGPSLMTRWTLAGAAIAVVGLIIWPNASSNY